MLQRRLRRLGVGADIGLTTVLQVLNSVVAFGIQAVVVRTLSKEAAGTYFLAQSVITIAASIGDFGIAAVVYPRLSIVKGVETPAFKAGVILRLLMIFVSWALTNAYLFFLGNPGLMLVVNVGYLMIFFSTRLSGMRQFLEILWRLQGRTYIFTGLATFEMAGTLAALLVLAYTHDLTVLSIMVTWVIAGVPGFFIILWPLWKTLRDSHYMQSALSNRYYRSIFLASLPIALMGVAGQMFAQLETLVINHFLTLADVSAYNAATRPLTGAIVLPMALSVGLIPIVAQAYRSVRADVSISFVISLAVRIILLVNLAMCAVCFVFSEQIMMIFGRQYLSEAYILRVYSITNGFVFLVIVFDQFLLAVGRRRQTLYGALFSFFLALILEASLVGRFGMMGILFSKMFSVLCLITFQLYVSRIDVRQAALAGFRRMLLPAVVLAVALVATIPIDNVILRGLIVFAAVGGAIFGTRGVLLSEIRTLKELRVA